MAKGLTIKQILAASTPRQKQAAQHVVVKDAKLGHRTKDGKPILRCKTYSTHNVDGYVKKHKPVYTTVIYGNAGEFDKLSQSNVKVSCNCISGETNVLTSKGWRQVQEIAEPLDRKKTLTYLVNGKKVIGTAPFQTGKKPVYHVSLFNGNSVTVTKDHRFLRVVKDKNASYSTEWVQLADLSIGDSVALSDHVTPSPTRDEDFLESFFIGVLMGDGTISGKHPDLQLFGDKVKAVSMLRRAEVVKNVKPTSHKNLNVQGVRVSFSQRAIELMTKYQFKNKESVRIQNHSQLMGYLSGLLFTDANIHRQISLNGGEGYLRLLQSYLIKYGYSGTRIACSREAGTYSNYGERKKDLFSLNFSANDMRKLAPNLVLREKQLSQLEYLMGKTSQNRYPYTKITAINYAGIQHVYDISVPETECFVADGGVILHNCPAFTFWGGEWALWRKGAADIIYGNGESPDIRNPKYSPYACKHSMQVMRLALKHKL